MNGNNLDECGIGMMNIGWGGERVGKLGRLVKNQM
jgi:hypothetical protein